MQGRQEYQPELFVMIKIESMIPQNHPLRKLDKIIDLSFVRKLTKSLYCKNNGRPSIDPELFFRMQLLACFYNIDSDRRLCQEVEFNLAYRWYCKLSLEDCVPDHSSMTKIRDRLGEKTYQKIFDKILNICRERGLVKDNISIFTDGTLMRADASLKSLVRRDKKGDPSEERDRPWHEKGQAYANKTHISKTDIDASLAAKPGQPKALYYKVHTSADIESRVIVDTQVTTGAAHDTTMFTTQIEAIENRDFEIEESIADRGYGAGENLEYLENKGIEHTIPLFKTSTGKKDEGFEYNAKKDIYTCPMGHKMKPGTPGELQTIYTMSSLTCRNCPLVETCLPKRKEFRAAKIGRHKYQNFFDEVLEREPTPEFQAKLNERMWSMEGLFAEAKTFHGLDRARYRGRWKVQAQAYLVASVQNLKRLMASSLFDLAIDLFKRTLISGKSILRQNIFCFGSINLLAA